MLSRLREQKLRAIEERYAAVAATIAALLKHSQVTVAAASLLQFLERAILALQSRVNDVRSQAQFYVMHDRDFDNALLRSRRVFDKLVVLMDDVAKTITFPAPPELRESLRAVVKGIFGANGELLLHSEPGINYTIVELREAQIETILEALSPFGHVKPPEVERFFSVGLPSAEYDQALVHCIIAHEFGHHAWDWRVLSKFLELKPDVAPFSTFDDATDQSAALILAGEWATEIAADLFALYLFGPAYTCAAIHYASALAALDEPTTTHPPIRLRLHILMDLMDEAYTIGQDENGERQFAYATNMADFFGMWRPTVEPKRLTASGGNVPKVIAIPVLDAIVRLAPRLRAMARRLAATYGSLYDVEQYSRDVLLVRCIANYIPPVQHLHEGSPQLSTTAGILNASWEYFLGGLEQFGRALPSELTADRHRLSQVFNEFVLKTLELAGLATRWWSARKD